MSNRKLLVLAAVLGVIAAGTALAQPAPTGKRGPPRPLNVQGVTWTCPPMITPPVTPVETDWWLDSPQGWLDRGAIDSTGQSPMFRCYYGLDRADPAARPVFSTHRVIPANYVGCTLGGPANTSLSCVIR